MRVRARFPLAVLAAALLAATPASADSASDAARLERRLDPETSARVMEIVDAAREAGLPTAPLVARALEGASQQARNESILVEVQKLSAALGEARRSLGHESKETEIVAGASALVAGVPTDSLARLRASRPAESLTISLVVLCDLVARGVPQPTASGAVLSAVRAGGTDRDLLRMREHVHDQIRRGAAPGGAAERGLRELLGRRLSARGPAGAPGKERAR